MVLTNPSNVDAYASLNPHFPAAFAALREMAAGNCPTGRYPVLERWPVLLPICWVRRLGRYAWEVIRAKDSSVQESLALSRTRTALMRRYDIL